MATKTRKLGGRLANLAARFRSDDDGRLQDQINDLGAELAEFKAKHKLTREDGHAAADVWLKNARIVSRNLSFRWDRALSFPAGGPFLDVNTLATMAVDAVIASDLFAKHVHKTIDECPVENGYSDISNVERDEMISRLSTELEERKFERARRENEKRREEADALLAEELAALEQKANGGSGA